MQKSRAALRVWRLTGNAARRHLLVFAVASFAVLANGAAKAASENIPQRAVLYDEDPSNPKGTKYEGTVSWRTEPIKAAGQPDELAVYADVEIPSRKLKLALSFRRNTDKSLPASHTAELRFTLPPDIVVSTVPGLLAKSSEQSRGTALAAVAVKVTEYFFMVGLWDNPADRAKNMQLLLDRTWFDVPMVYSSGRRAIIAIEKGTPGTDAFKAAFGSAIPALPPATSASGRGYAVQVSAENNEADALASYQVLQTKFPAVLGSRTPVVKREDGSGGVVYRAMVGPFATADEAFDLCETLKAAGGECIVQRN